MHCHSKVFGVVIQVVKVSSLSSRGLDTLVVIWATLLGFALEHRAALSIRVPVPWFRHQVFHNPPNQLDVGVEVLEVEVEVLEVDLRLLKVEANQQQAILEM